MTKEKNEYCGFSLFNDIEDVELKTRNRAVIMANIAEQYIMPLTFKIAVKGASLIVGYSCCIPKEERGVVFEKFKTIMQERKFILED